MLPLPCSKCNKKTSKDCIIPDTSASLSYAIGVSDSNSVGVNFIEKDTHNGKVMYMMPVNTSDFKVSASGEGLTPGSCITDIPPISNGNLSMQISSIDYNNTPDSADGSFVITGTLTCPDGSYMMNLTATWAFEKVPPAQTPASVEES